jgi:hypothetical protein
MVDDGLSLFCWLSSKKRNQLYYLLFIIGTWKVSVQTANERESRRGRVPSCTSSVCLFVRSASESAVVPSRDPVANRVSDSWSPPRIVESTVVSTLLGTSHYRVSILLLICSHGADLVIDSFQGYLLGIVQDHSSLQVRF